MKYFHEDDYCQVEILSSECLTWCLAQMDEIERFSTNHWDGNGWDKMMVREPAKFPIADRKFTTDDIIHSLCPPHDIDREVFTGYSTHRKVCPNTIAIMSDSKSCIYVSENTSVVDAMWVEYAKTWGSKIHRDKLLSFLSSNKLIIVDWSSGYVMGPSNLDFDRYESRFES